MKTEDSIRKERDRLLKLAQEVSEYDSPEILFAASHRIAMLDWVLSDAD